jgi:flagellar biosynthesis/type III secretory pathway protein FliH
LIEEGREQGREEGLERGEYIGTIRTLQDLLHRQQTPVQVLAQRTVEELRELCEELRKALDASR